MLQEHNPYILMYKIMQEKLDAQSQSTNPLQVILSLCMQLVLEKGTDKHHENLPTMMELAALLPLEYDKLSFRDIIIALHDDTDPDFTD